MLQPEVRDQINQDRSAANLHFILKTFKICSWPCQARSSLRYSGLVLVETNPQLTLSDFKVSFQQSLMLMLKMMTAVVWMVIRKVDFARFYLLRKSPFLLPVSFSDHSTPHRALHREPSTRT